MSNLQLERRQIMLKYLMDQVDNRCTDDYDPSTAMQAMNEYAYLAALSDQELEKLYIKSKGGNYGQEKF